MACNGTWGFVFECKHLLGRRSQWEFGSFKRSLSQQPWKWTDGLRPPINYSYTCFLGRLARGVSKAHECPVVQQRFSKEWLELKEARGKHGETYCGKSHSCYVGRCWKITWQEIRCLCGSFLTLCCYCSRRNCRVIVAASLKISAKRGLKGHPETKIQKDSLHLFTSLYISLHLFTSLYISLHLFTSLYISLPLASILYHVQTVAKTFWLKGDFQFRIWLQLHWNPSDRKQTAKFLIGFRLQTASCAIGRMYSPSRRTHLIPDAWVNDMLFYSHARGAKCIVMS